MRKRIRFAIPMTAMTTVFGFGMFTALLPVAASAQTTFYVDAATCPGLGVGSIADPFCRIQDAVVASMTGDEIIVAPGTYNELIDFLGKGITLRSTGGRDATIIDAGPVPDPGTGKPVVRCDSSEGEDAVLDGFTLTGGRRDNITKQGAGMFNNNSSPTVMNCTFTANDANFGPGSGFGGGMGNFNSSPTVINCLFNGNIASDGGGMFNNVGSNPTVERCTFSGNTVGSQGGGMANASNSNPTVSSCIFIGNTGPFGGGMGNNNSSPMVTNCWFSGNSATAGGGLFNVVGSHPTFTNCALSGNHADIGGGMTSDGTSSLTLTNCTFSRNTADTGGGLNNPGAAVLTNCIFWGNVASISDNEIANQLGATMTVSFSDIQRSFLGGKWDASLGVDAGGNIDADPLFVDADGADDLVGNADDNLRLSAGSPAIDAGRSFGTQLDLDGNLRIIDDPTTVDTGLGFPAVIDMRAFEFGSLALCGKPGDFDYDGDVDIFDYASFQFVFTGPMAP